MSSVDGYEPAKTESDVPRFLIGETRLEFRDRCCNNAESLDDFRYKGHIKTSCVTINSGLSVQPRPELQHTLGNGADGNAVQNRHVIQSDVQDLSIVEIFQVQDQLVTVVNLFEVFFVFLFGIKLFAASEELFLV